MNYDRTPQNGWKKPHWKNKKKPNYGHNNWHRQPYDQRDNRGPPQDQRDNRGAPYEQRDNRGPPYEPYGQRGRSPVPPYEYGYGERRGPPPQGPHRPYEHSPISTYNYYAPLRNQHEEDRHEGQYLSDTDYNRYFLRRGRENHPPRNTDETRNRRSPERREDVDQGRDNKRKRE